MFDSKLVMTCLTMVSDDLSPCCVACVSLGVGQGLIVEYIAIDRPRAIRRFARHESEEENSLDHRHMCAAPALRIASPGWDFGGALAPSPTAWWDRCSARTKPPERRDVLVVA